MRPSLDIYFFYPLQTFRPQLSDILQVIDPRSLQHCANARIKEAGSFARPIHSVSLVRRVEVWATVVNDALTGRLSTVAASDLPIVIEVPWDSKLIVQTSARINRAEQKRNTWLQQLGGNTHLLFPL
jgi:hypothetical protein